MTDNDQPSGGGVGGADLGWGVREAVCSKLTVCCADREEAVNYQIVIST